MNGIKKTTSPLVQLLKNKPNLFKTLKAGDLVEATLTAKSHRVAYFDVDGLGTGVVYGVELMNAQDILKNLAIGSKVSAKVVEPENDEGYIELSLTDAEKQRVWQIVKDLYERGEVIPVKIVGANSGGLIARLNEVSGFIPVSQLRNEHYPTTEDASDRAGIIDALQKLVGQELKVKIIDFNQRSNKLILSERESVEENVKEMLAKYKIGDVIDGIISGVADFGAFMRFADNPKIEGLIHVSELDHRLIESPKEVVKLNDAVKAKIIDIKDGRISLSLKALLPDPWLKANDVFKVGQEVEGVAVRLNPFGALVNLEHSLQGLIHVSEFGSVEEMKKQLEIGKSYKFVIDAIKPQEKRILLKLKK